MMELPTRYKNVWITEKDIERFKSKTAPPNETGCVLWLGCPDKNGYGRFSVKQQTFFAHRFHQQFILGHQIGPNDVCSHICKRHGATFNDKLCLTHIEITTQKGNLHEDCLGQSHHKASVQDEDVAMLIALYQEGGISQIDLAAILTEKGVPCHQSSVSRWLNRKGRTADSKYDAWFKTPKLQK